MGKCKIGPHSITSLFWIDFLYPTQNNIFWIWQKMTFLLFIQNYNRASIILFDGFVEQQVQLVLMHKLRVSGVQRYGNSFIDEIDLILKLVALKLDGQMDRHGYL